ncbi:MAG TPA: hypothetical protein VFG23_11215 [Polyangia bacterium]|nr:hypothetical protein [Polyangia bacterium]
MNDEQELLDSIRLYLPKYLTPEQARDLWSGLADFPKNTDYYWFDSGLNDEILQGDGWRGFVVRDFFSGDKRAVSGVVLSNSCDVAPENETNTPAHIVFAPLISVSKFEDLLRGRGKTLQQVASLLTDVRQQRLTNIFYLPAYSDVIKESMILLDDVHVHPATDFRGCDRNALFKLNQYAFYLFLMKLSIHFSRFNEKVLRFRAA